MNLFNRIPCFFGFHVNSEPKWDCDISGSTEHLFVKCLVCGHVHRDWSTTREATRDWNGFDEEHAR